MALPDAGGRIHLAPVRRVVERARSAVCRPVRRDDRERVRRVPARHGPGVGRDRRVGSEVFSSSLEVFPGASRLHQGAVYPGPDLPHGPSGDTTRDVENGPVDCRGLRRDPRCGLWISNRFRVGFPAILRDPVPVSRWRFVSQPAIEARRRRPVRGRVHGECMAGCLLVGPIAPGLSMARRGPRVREPVLRASGRGGCTIRREPRIPR